MAALVVPYVIPLFLGMTFDAQNYKPGVDIYDEKYAEFPHITHFGTSESTYKVTNSLSEVENAMSISGDLALKLKAGQLDLSGKGTYLQNEKDYRSRVDILTTLTYKAKTVSLNGTAEPREKWWEMYTPEVLGTHYVASINYGVEMIASAKFVVHNSSQVDDVKGEIRTSLGDEGKGIDLSGKLENLDKKLKGKCTLEISFFGTGPLTSVVSSISGLMDLIRDFPKRIEEEGMTEGFPLSLNLEPLTKLAPKSEKSKFAFRKNPKLQNRLEEFEENLDDLTEARSDLVSWAKKLPYTLKPEYEEEIGVLLDNITEVSKLYFDVTAKLDVTKDADQLARAFDAYNYDGGEEYRRFSNRVSNLKYKIDPLVDRTQVSTDTYVHWGSNLCTAKGTILLYDGFTFSSSEEGIGGAAEYSCAPNTIDVGYDLSPTGIVTEIAGIRYPELGKESNPFQGKYARQISGKGVPCAKCHAPESATVAMFSATTSCPGTWQTMYSGYLMSARKLEGHTTEYICVDEYPSEPYEMKPEEYSKDTIALTIVHSLGSLPKETYIDGELVRCVVCAIMSSQAIF